MRKTAVVIAPGRGTYNRPELGYLSRNHGVRAELLAEFDAARLKWGQPGLTELDGASRYSPSVHTRGDNASGLIFACAYLDFLSIDRQKFDILGVTGNSMGWYTALACGGALSPQNAFHVANIMGTLMHESMIGGQLIYPFFDENWDPITGAYDGILAKISDINSRSGRHLYVSIKLGGMLVLAGNTEGLQAFQSEMPVVQERFPMVLPNHAAFHTQMQAPVAAQGRAQLPKEMFRQPELNMIDGRGAIWQPHAINREDLWAYTLDHQVVEPFDFTAAIKTGAREFMPDVFIVLGPGNTLGGAVAQSLVGCSWRGAGDKAAFKNAQTDAPLLLSMGLADQRALLVG